MVAIIKRLRASDKFAIISVATRICLCIIALALLWVWMVSGIKPASKDASMLLAYMLSGSVTILACFRKDLSTFAPWWSKKAFFALCYGIGLLAIMLRFDLFSIGTGVLILAISTTPILVLWIIGGIRALTQLKELQTRRKALRAYANTPSRERETVRLLHKMTENDRWQLDV